MSGLLCMAQQKGSRPSCTKRNSSPSTIKKKKHYHYMFIGEVTWHDDILVNIS